MPSPSIVPASDDHDVYLVLDSFGEKLGRSWRETDERDTDLQTLVRDLIDGQYSDPVRIVAFNTAEHWSQDVSDDIAEILRRRLTDLNKIVPPSLEGFLDRYDDRRLGIQLALPM
ncbi:hypothetical protein ACVIGB_001131 [Bradyrhizobium sp. USDA 4341]